MTLRVSELWSWSRRSDPSLSCLWLFFCDPDLPLARAMPARRLPLRTDGPSMRLISNVSASKRLFRFVGFTNKLRVEGFDQAPNKNLAKPHVQRLCQTR